MKAFHPDFIPSEIVSVNVGVDVYQKPPALSATLVPGLKCRYYEGEAFQVSGIKDLSLINERVVQDFSINARKRDENFAFVYTGFIQILKDGIYTFYLSSNDGSRLYLNEDLFIDNDGPHGNKEVLNAMALHKGAYPLQLFYFQWGGGLNLNVSWEGPGFEKTAIPTSVLFHKSIK
jgi:alpha-L-fucosidase